MLDRGMPARERAAERRRARPEAADAEGRPAPAARLAEAAGNRAFASAVAAGRVGAGGLLLRYDAPAEVTAVPVRQKAYYRIREAVADLERIVPMLSYNPPGYDTAKIIVQSVYRSVDDWMGEMLKTDRLMKVFGTQWTGVHRTCWEARNAIGEMFGILDRAQFDAKLRDETGPKPTLLDVKLAEVRFAVPYLERLEDAVSFELPGAEGLPDVPTKFTRLPRTEMHVLAWLQKHQPEIASAAGQFKVDRRAIAGAIAWEAIVQVKGSSVRAVGPGKAHSWEFRGMAAVDEVEKMGYMPRSGSEDRQREILETAAGSTRYIGAIMSACADISARHGLQIRDDPGVLTTIYQGWKPSEWEEHMEDRAEDHPAGSPWPRPVVANPMGLWVDQHLPYLEEAVGFTAAEAKAIGEAPHGATAEGRTAPAP
jgi:hypothetical protein